MISFGQKADKKSNETITITGKVLNSDKKPVEGAVFYVDNIKTNVRSSVKGSYKLKTSSSAINLEVKSPEFGSSEAAINGQKKIDFILNGTGEGQELSQENTTKEKVNAVSQNKPPKKKAKKMNTYANIYQMIRGEVSGVLVSGRSIQIQQGHSFFGSSEPLYVVNGVVVPSIDAVNPLEVKSIEVLKGSAAAIYGVRGANGVLKITLLNGSETEK